MKPILKKIIPDALIRTFWHFPRAVCANAVFGFPARNLTCIAVAGTKGKTSTAFFLAYLLKSAGIKTALFSTAAVHDGTREELNLWKMTTPDACSVQRFLHRARTNGCTHAVIEVSSHALKQHRVWGISFSVVIITNLSPDHLEYHASAEEYVRVHQRLFSRHTRAYCAPKEILAQKMGSGTNSLCEIEPDPIFTRYKQWWFPLQRANIRAALCAAQTLDISEEKYTAALEMLPPPPGRFESIDEGQPFRIIVDYAHSPESLIYFLSQMRPLVSGSLWVVFGACGDRDKEQRPRMGAILERYADRIIITTDDPYSENPADIAHDIEKGFTMKTKMASGTNSLREIEPDPIFVTILDRKEAIEYVIARAQHKDCVCILGKGAEQWQIFRDTKIPWDDRHIVRDVIRART